MQLFSTILTAFAVAASVSASPLSFTHPRSSDISLIVVSPDITSPTVGQIWTVGSTQNVTWDTSKIPDSGKNNTGLILLGYSEAGSDSENLDISEYLISLVR